MIPELEKWVKVIKTNPLKYYWDKKIIKNHAVELQYLENTKLLPILSMDDSEVVMKGS